MSEGISGSRPFGERYRDATGQQGDAQFPLSAPTGPMFRSRDPENESPRYEHHRRFSPSQLQHLDQMGIPNDGVSTVYFSHGEQGAREAYQFARYISGGPNGAPAILANVRDTGNPEFQGELDRLRREGAATDALTAGLSIGAGGAAASRTGSPQVVSARRSDGGGHSQGNSGPNGGGWGSGPGRPGGGGTPRGPHGGGGTATATIPETLRGAGAPRAPAANVITPTDGRLGNTAGPQASLVQPQLSPSANAAAQFALGNQPQGPSTQRQAETQNPGLIPDGLGPQVATGINEGRRPAPDTTGAGLGAAAQEQLNSGRSGQGPAQGREGFGLADMEGAPQDPVHGPAARARNEEETDQRLRRLEQQFQRDRDAAQTQNEARSAQVRERLDNINASVPAREDFQIAADIVDALPETLGPERFAAYEKIMTDPIWRRALEDQAHNPDFLDFVQSIIAGNIDPQVATNRLRNNDPDTVGAPPLTGLSRGREWDIPDVERLLRPNEQDAFRRYAEAFPDVAQIVFEAGYDASAGQMRDAIRALLNGAYGQDVAASLRSGGLAGGRGGPPFNTGPYTGTGGEFVDPERQPDTQQADRAEERRRIIVPGAANTQNLPPDYQYDPDDPDNLIIVPEEVAGSSQIDTTTPLHTLTPAELLRNARLSQAAGAPPRDQIQEVLGPGTTVIIRRSRDFGNYDGPVQDGHVHDGFTLNTTAGLQILGLDPAEFADLPGVGAGTYDTSWDANLPQDNVFETVQRYNQRVHAYYERMGGFSNSFAVRPIISDPVTYCDPKTEECLPAYYVARVGGQNLIGLLRFDWERGVAYVDEMISDRYGVPTIMPVEMPIEVAAEILGHPIPPDTEFIEYYQAPVGCELHYGTVDDNRAMLFNSAIMMMFYDEQYPNDNIFDYKVIGTMSGVPYQPEASNAIYETSHAANQLSDKLGIPRDLLLMNQGETNLSKENIHTASGSLHIADWTPEVWAHVNEYMDSLAGTGQVITIHCDLRQAVDVEPGAVFNQWPPSLATFFTESQVSNREHIVRLTNEHPDGIFVLAHTGLNVTGPVRPDHADDLRWMLENAVHNNLYFDMSWAAVYLSYAEFSELYGQLIKDYPDRFIWGSDNLPQFATDGESPTIGVLEEFFNTGVTEHLSQEEMERLFAQNYEDVFIAGGRRHGEWRADPANAEWLATREPGDFTPPKIWTRDADGEFHFIANPKFEATE